MGSAWAESGFTDGGQIGLIYATIGFAWSIGIGVPLVIWGRRRGLLTPASTESTVAEIAVPEATSASQLSLEPLGARLVAIGVVYLATYGVVWVLANVVFSSMPGLSKMAWGFHFIFGALLAMWARPVVRKVVPGVLDDQFIGPSRFDGR